MEISVVVWIILTSESYFFLANQNHVHLLDYSLRGNQEILIIL
jgi:hypothetical protein